MLSAPSGNLCVPAPRRRAALLQNAVTLIANAQADALPGHGPARIAAFQATLKNYKDATQSQTGTNEESGDDRITRDNLVAAIKHAADRLHPYTDEENLPVRHTFALPPDRPLRG